MMHGWGGLTLIHRMLDSHRPMSSNKSEHGAKFTKSLSTFGSPQAADGRNLVSGESRRSGRVWTLNGQLWSCQAPIPEPPIARSSSRAGCQSRFGPLHIASALQNNYLEDKRLTRPQLPALSSMSVILTAYTNVVTGRVSAFFTKGPPSFPRKRQGAMMYILCIL